MFKYIKAFFTHRPKLYRGTTDKFCRNLTARGRRIRIWGIAIGPFMIAFHLLDLTHVQDRRTNPVVERDSSVH